ncbi:FAD/NAD(P)-binding protein [Patescibacteria group bacterium]|nr:FAD/NAD(P)-binding protein [Patescibacteria group bacterium]MBU1890405.1 FAD/NAD(P)-binding protein [Patescibacteria group bacterium]
MKNPYYSHPAKILKIRKESPDSNLYTLQFKEAKIQKAFHFHPGQFVMAGIVGYGEGPFDICSSSMETTTFDLSIRKVGKITQKIHTLEVGDTISVRGPYGHGFPMTKLNQKNLLLLGGGCGFVTMRTVILDYIKQKPKGQKIQVFFGVRSEKDFLFRQEFATWSKHVDLHLIIAEAKEKKSRYHQGVITDLFDKVKLLDNLAVIACGPPIMYKFCLARLKDYPISDEDIYLSLERRMDCGTGVCQHCAIGPYYVCKDGPVFSYGKIKDIQGAI